MHKHLFTLVFLATACGSPEPTGKLLSLTGDGFVGKKHYFGFAERLSGMMGNETKYDVRHTHDIFSSGDGGDYEATRLDDREIDGDDIRGVFGDLRGKVSADDMYVQYSSGHGYESGLGVGVTYDEMASAALGLHAHETIVFTMACHSGGLVESFERKRAEWRDFASTNRTLFVMASSRADQLSSTGPGRDSDEPGGPDGSAGSAFGHALWKALIGNADGYLDGFQDGYVSLGEIDAYVRMKTKDVGGHDPVVTGVFESGLIMNRVPQRTHGGRTNASVH